MVAVAHHPECTCLDGGCDRRLSRGERMDVADHLSAITAKLSQHIKDDAAVSEIVDMVLAYRRVS